MKLTPQGEKRLTNYAENLLSNGEKKAQIIQKKHADDELFRIMRLRPPIRQENNARIGFKEYAASSVFMTGALLQGKASPLHFKALDAMKEVAEKKPHWKKGILEEARAVSVHMPKIAEFFFDAKHNGGKEAKRDSFGNSLLKMHEEFIEESDNAVNDIKKEFRLKESELGFPTQYNARQRKALEVDQENRIASEKENRSAEFRINVYNRLIDKFGKATGSDDAKAIARYFAFNAHHVADALGRISGKKRV